jgi:hypothetical protein
LRVYGFGFRVQGGSEGPQKLEHGKAEPDQKGRRSLSMARLSRIRRAAEA